MDATIVGTGQMAVMCARLLTDNGHRVRLVGRDETIDTMRRTRRSPQLPAVPVPESCELAATPVSGDLLVLAVPTQVMRERLAAFEDIRDTGPIVTCAKGIELESNQRPSEVVRSLFEERPVVALSGPNIAPEVVARKPAGAVVACEDLAVAERVRDAFATDYFRVYTNDDVVGVELAGALKNVIAIAAGVIDGLDLGNNAKAALLTRGIVEITRLGVAMGAKAETFAGLAGMGDLVTTCISPEGRNRRLGEMIGRGDSLELALAKLGSVCEGVPTTKAVCGLAGKHGVDMPIATAIHGVLFEAKDVRTALLELMTRQPKSE
jgi:glycerol-3-phosphate dehydrogenase (NAD(P)+)